MWVSPIPEGHAELCDAGMFSNAGGVFVFPGDELGALQICGLRSLAGSFKRMDCGCNHSKKRMHGRA